MRSSWPVTDWRKGLQAVIISDLHLGSPHTRTERILALLDKLPPGVELVLNGDTLDRSSGEMSDEHRVVSERLFAERKLRPLVWICGNHDVLFQPPELEVLETYQVSPGVMVAHGHHFHGSCKWLRPFFRICKALIWLRTSCHGSGIHPAAYAKRWPTLYSWLRKEVRDNARRFAKAQGCEVMICGHVHFSEDSTVDGVRYVNSGAWTEDSTHCVLIYEDQRTELVEDPDLVLV